MNNKTAIKGVPVKQPIVLHADAGKTELANREGYRMVISCNHDNTKSGSKAPTKTRS